MTSEAFGIRHGEGNTVDLMLSPPGLLNGTHHPHPPHTPPPWLTSQLEFREGGVGEGKKKKGGWKLELIHSSFTPALCAVACRASQPPDAPRACAG